MLIILLHIIIQRIVSDLVGRGLYILVYILGSS